MTILRNKHDTCPADTQRYDVEAEHEAALEAAYEAWQDSMCNVDLVPEDEPRFWSEHEEHACAKVAALFGNNIF